MYLPYSINYFCILCIRLVQLWFLKPVNQLQVKQHGNGDYEDLKVLLADLANVDNSRERASKLFQWLISPVPSKTFFRFLQNATSNEHF